MAIRKKLGQLGLLKMYGYCTQYQSVQKWNFSFYSSAGLIDKPTGR